MLEEHLPGVLLARVRSLDDFTPQQGEALRETIALENGDTGPVSLVIDVSPEVARAQLDTGRFWLRLAEEGLLKSLAIVSPWAAVRLMGRAVALAAHQRGLQVDVDTFTNPDEALRWARSEPSPVTH